MFVVCRFILGDCKKYFLVKHSFLEGDFSFLMKLRWTHQILKRHVTEYAALLSDEGT